jgi:membrane protein implicated in regulation of membrane protease activity
MFSKVIGVILLVVALAAEGYFLYWLASVDVRLVFSVMSFLVAIIAFSLSMQLFRNRKG